MLRFSLFGATALSFFVLGSFACSSSGSSSASPTGPASTADGGAGGQADAATAAREPCPEGTRENGDACDTKLTFKSTADALSPARDHHTTHIFDVGSDHYLYVFGGTPSWATIYDDILRAKIGADGSLGAFESAGTIPHKRAGHMTARVKDKVILVGGSTLSAGSMTISATVDVGTFGADGKISGWVDGPKMPEGVMHHTIAVVGDWLFVFGGRGQTTGASVDQVLRAKLGDDGVPGAFEKLAPLPEKRSHAMTFQVGRWVYIAGGLTGDPVENPPSRSDIIRTTIGDDGSLGDWETVGKFPTGGLSVSAAQVFGRSVYFMGGLPGGSSYTKNVYTAHINEDGSLGPVTALPTKLPTARAHVHQTPVLGHNIYSVGGHLDSESSTGEVVVGTFAAP